jgi:hypothetical protein
MIVRFCPYPIRLSVSSGIVFPCGGSSEARATGAGASGTGISGARVFGLGTTGINGSGAHVAQPPSSS